MADSKKKNAPPNPVKGSTTQVAAIAAAHVWRACYVE
jgi:hypothetical protein